MKSIGQKFFHVNDVTKKTVNRVKLIRTEKVAFFVTMLSLFV